MGKAPAFQWCPSDWRRDTQIQMASMETRGVWFEMLCCMWDAPERGKLSGTRDQLSMLLGCPIEILNRALIEIENLKIGNIVNSHNNVTIADIGMLRDQIDRDNARLRKQKQRDREGSHKNVTPPYKEIIQYLNQKTGKGFNHETDNTKRFINARWREGYRLVDFVIVIDNKCSKWLNEPKMIDYLRPQTLFGTKFEAYRNEIKHPLQGLVSDKTIRTIENLKEWMEESDEK